MSGTAGVPPANAPQARSLSEVASNPFSRFALIAGGTPAVPDNHLTLGVLGNGSIEANQQRLETRIGSERLQPWIDAHKGEPDCMFALS